MVNIKEIERIITKYLYHNFIYDSKTVFKNTDSLTKSGYIDSIGIMEFIEFLSDKFKVEIPDSELTPENLDTIKCAAKLISKLVK